VTTPGNECIRRAIKIESGAKSALDPHSTVTVKPYIDDELPDLDLSVTNVKTVDPRRTFWDKIVILSSGPFGKWIDHYRAALPLRCGATNSPHHGHFAAQMPPENCRRGTALSAHRADHSRDQSNRASRQTPPPAHVQAWRHCADGLTFDRSDTAIRPHPRGTESCLSSVGRISYRAM